MEAGGAQRRAERVGAGCRPGGHRLGARGEQKHGAAPGVWRVPHARTCLRTPSQAQLSLLWGRRGVSALPGTQRDLGQSRELGSTP